jgi:hypothetical protein
MAIGRWYERGSYQSRFIVYLACVVFPAVAMSLFLRRARGQNSHDPDIGFRHSRFPSKTSHVRLIPPWMPDSSPRGCRDWGRPRGFILAGRGNGAEAEARDRGRAGIRTQLKCAEDLVR